VYLCCKNSVCHYTECRHIKYVRKVAYLPDFSEASLAEYVAFFGSRYGTWTKIFIVNVILTKSANSPNWFKDDTNWALLDKIACLCIN
jgi:hypothetical protein